MHLCQLFLGGAPYAYFGAPSGAPCTPVEERWFRQKAWYWCFDGIVFFEHNYTSNTSYTCIAL